MRYLICIAFFAGLSSVFAQPCKATPEVKAAIDALLGTRIDVWRQQIRDRFPADYFAHLQYLKSQERAGVYPSSVRDEYQKLYDAHADDVLIASLYATVLTGTKTPDAIKIFERVIEREPHYAPALLKLTEIYASPMFHDAKKVESDADAYIAACPAEFEVYTYLRQIFNQDFAARLAERLRKLLEGRTDPAALGMYTTLWRIEFRAVPLPDQATVRDRVRDDAKLLRAQYKNEPSLARELKQGYQLISDAEGEKWADAELAKSRPAAASGDPVTLIAQWNMANSQKTGYAREEYLEKRLKHAQEMVRQYPESPLAREQVFSTLIMSPNASLEDRIAAGEAWIHTFEAHPSTTGGSIPYMQVAQLYSRSNTHYNELPALLEKALAPSQLTAPISDLYRSATQDFRQDLGATSDMNSAAGIFLKIGKLDRARELLTRVGSELSSMTPPDSTIEWQKSMYQSLKREYWTNMAALAQAEHNGEAYLTAERNSLLSHPNTFPVNDYQVRILRDSFKSIRGTDEGFDAWFGKPTSTQAQNVINTPMDRWVTLEKPLPDFQLTDATGKKWRLDDLKGKVAFINFWATWCGPCREELPFVQKLSDKLGKRTDVIVLTLNTDDNTGLIEPFLRKNNYSFTVLPAAEYASGLKVDGIPRNWIVDAKGVVRKETVGFGLPGADTWVDKMIAEIDRTK